MESEMRQPIYAWTVIVEGRVDTVGEKIQLHI